MHQVLLESVGLICLSAYLNFTKQVGAPYSASMGIAFLVAAALYSSVNWPYKSAKRIQKITESPKGKKDKQAKKS
jgi:hypothetical protein